jgi:hypothetical protein
VIRLDDEYMYGSYCPPIFFNVRTPILASISDERQRQTGDDRDGEGQCMHGLLLAA